MTKLKLLTLSDHILCPSGVGSQARYLVEGLLRTGRYQVLSIGGAIRHHNYQPIRLEEFGEDLTILPVDGYGNPPLIRNLLERFQPDALFMITDPRFFTWLFEMSDEVRERGVPMLYWTIWDELPTPKYNLPYYKSCDFLGCISKLTYGIMKDLGLEERSEWIPHAVNADIFKPMFHNERERIAARAEILGAENVDKFVVFYNSRNARRKMTADVLKTFKMFLNDIGQSRAFLFMHTDPHDQEGSNLFAVADMLGLNNSQIKFSSQGQPTETIAKFYNISDVTINISNNEGWGLSCHESLSCGVPAIVNRTGGLQDQIKDDRGNVFGVCIEPATCSLQGSQQIPYINDCRAADKDVVAAFHKLYNMSPEARKKLGLAGREWTLRAFPMSRMIGQWDNAIQRYVEKYRSQNQFTQLQCAAL